MLNAKKEWVAPDLQIFGDMRALTLEGGEGGGTGNTGTGECSGKGCGVGDTFANSQQTGWVTSSL